VGDSWRAAAAQKITNDICVTYRQRQAKQNIFSSLPNLRIPLGENMDELPVDRELSTAGLRHLHVGAVEPEVGGVVPVHINWIKPKATVRIFLCT
jgi:hypothetical protein